MKRIQPFACKSLFIGILLAGVLLAPNVFGRGGDRNRAGSRENIVALYPSSGDPCVVACNDSDLIPLASRGNGTTGNPYVIENLSILANHSIGINLSNTRVHVKIRNCTVVNGSWGISLSNVTNVVVDNCTVAGSEGAYPYGIGIVVANSSEAAITGSSVLDCDEGTVNIGENCSDLVIEGNFFRITHPLLQLHMLNGMDVLVVNNTFEGGWMSTLLVNVDNATLENNSFLEVSEFGIKATHCDDIQVINNSFIVTSGSYRKSISVQSSNDIAVNDNWFEYSSLANRPIMLKNISGIELKGNEMHDVEYCVEIEDCDSFSISMNVIEPLNSYDAFGLNLKNCSVGNVFENQFFEEHTLQIIVNETSSNINFSDNHIEGYFLCSDSSEVHLLNNTHDGNYGGGISTLYFTNVTGMTVSKSFYVDIQIMEYSGGIISDCVFFKVRMIDSNNTIWLGNDVIERGISLDHSSNNTFFNNTVTESIDYGVHLENESNYNNITGNVFHNVTSVSILVENSSQNVIAHNIIDESFVLDYIVETGSSTNNTFLNNTLVAYRPPYLFGSSSLHYHHEGVVLNWTGISWADSYWVFRDVVPFATTGGMLPVATIPGNTTSYTDHTPFNGVYYYTVVAGVPSTNTSMSECKPFTVTYLLGEPLVHAPKIKSSLTGAVRIRWEPVENATGYKICWSTTGEFDFDGIAMTKSLENVTSTSIKIYNYHGDVQFAVIATDGFSYSNQSNVIHTSIILTQGEFIALICALLTIGIPVTIPLVKTSRKVWKVKKQWEKGKGRDVEKTVDDDGCLARDFFDRD
ncbi:MAG: right-handed parallel beta-helix repeat-containing protein [Promethearchaeota archaeon]